MNQSIDWNVSKCRLKNSNINQTIVYNIEEGKVLINVTEYISLIKKCLRLEIKLNNYKGFITHCQFILHEYNEPDYLIKVFNSEHVKQMLSDNDQI